MDLSVGMVAYFFQRLAGVFTGCYLWVLGSLGFLAFYLVGIGKQR